MLCFVRDLEQARSELLAAITGGEVQGYIHW